MIMERLGCRGGDFPTRGFGVAPCRRRRGEASCGRRLPAGPCQIQEFRFALTQPEGEGTGRGSRQSRAPQSVWEASSGVLALRAGQTPTAPTKPGPHSFMLLCSGRWDTWSLKNLSPASPDVRAVVHLCFHQMATCLGPRAAPQVPGARAVTGATGQSRHSTVQRLGR